MFEFIKKLRSTEKGRTLFKFLLYMAFFVFVLILAITSGATKGETPKNTSSKESESIEHSEERAISYFEKQKKLYSSKYEFSYTYKGEKNINFYGEVDAGNVDGFKETDAELIHYTIENGVVYQKKMDEKVVIENLYEGMDASLFDLKGLFDKLNANNATIESGDDKKTYSYKLDDYSYKVTTNREAITKIDISSEVDYYEFNFEY